MNLSSALARIAERFDLRDIYVFGSRADEVAARVRRDHEITSSPDSDVDIAVEPRRGRRLDARSRVRLGIALEDLLEVARVDLIVLSEARPFLAFEVVKGELLYTSDPVAQAEHELYVLRRVGDLAHMERERVRMILEGGPR